MGWVVELTLEKYSSRVLICCLRGVPYTKVRFSLLNQLLVVPCLPSLLYNWFTVNKLLDPCSLVWRNETARCLWEVKKIYNSNPTVHIYNKLTHSKLATFHSLDCFVKYFSVWVAALIQTKLYLDYPVKFHSFSQCIQQKLAESLNWRDALCISLELPKQAEWTHTLCLADLAQAHFFGIVIIIIVPWIKSSIRTFGRVTTTPSSSIIMSLQKEIQLPYFIFKHTEL